MAYKVAAATGAWSAAATWNSVTNTPTLHASTNITISTSNLFTATFTAPNTTNACTGVLLYINAIGSGGTVTVTLQESTVDTAAARSIAVTSLVAGTWVYFRFATPYVFTTTSAGAYRFKIVNAGAAGTTNAAADSGGSNIAYLATDDRTGVPASTDDVFICGPNQSALTVTMDGTQSIGSAADTALATQRALGNAISLNNLGVLAWDTTADATLTCQGNIICNNNGGELQMGTVASPMPAARLARLRFTMAADGNHGLRTFASGKLTLQGTPKSSTTLWKAKLSSGTGTAASPAIMDTAVDWSVGDEVCIGTTDTYDHNEYRFIITKNSATSYVWSSTSGGAEAALTHTHTTDAWVVNIQRNVLIDSTNSVRGWYYSNICTTAGNVDIDWARFDVVGAASGVSKGGFTVLDASSVTGACDYSVCSRHQIGFLFQSSVVSLSFTGLVMVNQRATSSNFLIQNSAHNKSFTDCFAFGGQRSGFQVSATFNLTFTTCYSIGNNSSNDSGSSGWLFGSGGATIFNSCESHANRQSGIRNGGMVSTVANSFLCGTKGSNVTDIAITANGFTTMVFINSSFGSATFVSNYLQMLAGSSLQFHSYNGSANNHIWYTPQGSGRSTGSGLADTTVRTASSLGLRIAPEDTTTGFIWEFLIGIDANSAASIFGFARKNTAFGSSVCTVELFLPGSTTADATATLSNTTEAWQVFNLAASYTGSVASFATIRITAKTTTAAAYVYFDDFYNGTNVLTALDAWYQGKPTPVMTDLLGDPASVWAILKSTQTTAGTMGYEITQDLDSLQTEVAAVKAYVDDLETRLTANRAGYLDNLNVGGNVASAASIVSLAAAVAALNNLSAAQVWDLTDGIETGLTPRQATRLIVAALAGLLSGAGTTTITIKNAVVGNKNRIVATVDSDGNRTAIIYDLT